MYWVPDELITKMADLSSYNPVHSQSHENLSTRHDIFDVFGNIYLWTFSLLEYLKDEYNVSTMFNCEKWNKWQKIGCMTEAKEWFSFIIYQAELILT